jgi:hypothetical protein
MKPVYSWKSHSSVKFGSRSFLKFKLSVKHRIEDQFQIEAPLCTAFKFNY